VPVYKIKEKIISLSVSQTRTTDVVVAVIFMRFCRNLLIFICYYIYVHTSSLSSISKLVPCASHCRLMDEVPLWLPPYQELRVCAAHHTGEDASPPRRRRFRLPRAGPGVRTAIRTARDPRVYPSPATDGHAPTSRSRAYCPPSLPEDRSPLTTKSRRVFAEAEVV